MEFLREKCLIDHQSTADETIEFLLPQNPISFIVIDVVAELTDSSGPMEWPQFAKHIRLINIRYDHRIILFTDGSEQNALYCGLTGRQPGYYRDRHIETNFGMSSIIIPFGRELFNTDEMCPEVDRGRLDMTVQIDAVRDNSTNPTINVTAITIPQAKPTKMLTYYARSAELSAGVEYFHDIKRSGLLVGQLLADYALPSGIDGPYMWDDVYLLLDRRPYYYHGIDWEEIWNQWAWRRQNYYDQATWGDNAYQRFVSLEEFAWLDYDPDKSLRFAPDLTQYEKAEIRHVCGVSNWYGLYNVILADHNTVLGGD